MLKKGRIYQMLKEIKLDKWIKSGEGGNSVSYDNINDNNILLKLAKNHVRSVDCMKNEMNVIDKAMALNISTPKMIEKVECNGRIGLIYERIHNKKSLGRLCHDNPQNIKEYAKEFARETIKIHSIKCSDKGLQNYKDLYIEALTSGTQDKKYTKKVIDLIKSVLSSFKFVRDIFHMSKAQLIELWDSFIREYAYASNSDYDKLIERIKRLSVVYFFKIWASAEHHIPVLYQIVHRNARKYYDEIIGN